jgi:hypothetical protein
MFLKLLKSSIDTDFIFIFVRNPSSRHVKPVFTPLNLSKILRFGVYRLVNSILILIGFTRL